MQLTLLVEEVASPFESLLQVRFEILILNTSAGGIESLLNINLVSELSIQRTVRGHNVFTVVLQEVLVLGLRQRKNLLLTGVFSRCKEVFFMVGIFL